MFRIVATYRGQQEEVDHAETRREALYMLGEYRMAFGPDWTIWIVEGESE